MEETVRDVKESKKKKRKSSCNFISSDQQQLSSSHKKRKSSTRVVSPYFQKEVSKKTDNGSDLEEEKTAFYDGKCKLVTEANSSFKSFDDMLSRFAYKGDSIAHLHVRKVGEQKQELLNGCNEEERRKAHLQVRKVSPYFQTATGDTKTKQEIAPKNSAAHLQVRTAGCKDSKTKQEISQGTRNGESKNSREDHLQARKVSPYFQTATVRKQEQEVINGCNEEEEILQGRRKGETKKSIALLQVRKVSPYFQTATAGCKDSKTKEEISQGKTKRERKKQKVLNGCKEEEEISQGRRKGETKKSIALLQVRKVSPYFQTAGCKDSKTKEETSQGKTKGGRRKQKVLNGCKDEEISQGKTKGESKKQKVLNGCKDSKTKLKPPKPCAKSCRKKVKLSPYFKKVAKQEEIADGGITSPEETKKPVHKKLKNLAKEEEIADGGIASPEETKKPGHKKKKQQSQVLTAAQKRDKAYLRKTPDNTWIPPPSGLDIPLLQENQVHDPWRVLVICMLLNITSGKQARRVITKLFRLCPDAKTATEVPTEEIEKVIQTLGLQKKRSMMIQRMSQEYLSEDWTHVTQLHGIGKYAADAYAIFCTGNWEQVHPEDHKLTKYWDLLKSEGTDKTKIS
ncbi:hypothetical protein LWI29_005807 [Acer saccharum]|uniref:HhH-GPD domain-containing protein n=1 Tax=Acer saccharum TaxID=4024 RepID=A0AA39S6B6_ACESA|nr:hypothetical protein LWI29_005807 [Acer saccharum]KAK1564408.1 hypothetical protein Q3G72_002620 [Acer saccharum]